MSPEEINAIRRYLRNNGLKYYDVQAELIDHFACAMEEEQDKDPDISFKVALLRAHRKFGGRKGFNDYLDAARSRVKKKIISILLTCMIDFLGWPLVLATLGIVAGWYFYLNSIPEEAMLWPHLIVLQLLAGATLLYNHILLRSTPLYITRHVSLGLYFFFYLPLILPFCFANIFELVLNYNWFSLLYFSVVSLMILAALKLPERITEETRRLYPTID